MSKSDLSTQERFKQIMIHLNQHGQILVDDLAEKLDVSPSTVRRDLTQMERQGLLRRFHGGAELVQPLLYEPFRTSITFSNQEGLNSEEKRRIAKAAADMIQSGKIVAFSSGTTTTQITRYLGHVSDVTIVTNTVNVAMELSQRQDINVFVTGGYLSGGWFSLVGEAALQAIKSLYFDTVFIGLNGIDPQNGLTSHYVDEAAIVRGMIHQANQKIVVADHSKIGVTARARICEIDKVDMLITDDMVSVEHVTAFENAGLQVLTV
ncbi:MAG: DeoR/GlpR transcriptional regulator [Anaerolineaceae bacterium]|nr:DeoR/GlpR transcriptional regulator [Anaerolineaceae bacterium]